MVTARDIHPDTYAAICDPSGFFPIVLFHVDWPGAPLFAHSNRGTISWDGHSWTGVGNIADIALPGNSFGMAAQEGAISILGFGDELDAYLEMDARDRAVSIYFGVVAERDGATLIGEPFEVFSSSINGLEDLTEAVAKGRTRGLRVPLMSGPSQRATSAAVHSFEDQNRDYPGDTAGRLLINAEREARRLRWPE